MKEDIKVSIITVVYNGEKYLEQTIQSVLNQSYNNIEYIIIDGGSTDGTIDIIKKYEDNLAYWVSEKDNGIYDAMNKGILQSTGELVGIINADDWYESDIVYKIVNSYNLYNKPDILYGNMKFINEETNQYKLIIPSEDGLKRDMTLNHPTCFVSRGIYNEKMFDTNYKICADYDLMMYFKTKNKNFQYVNILITNMRIGGASDNFILSSSEVFKVQKCYFGILSASLNIFKRYSRRFLRNFLNIFISLDKINKVKGFTQ